MTNSLEFENRARFELFESQERTLIFFRKCEKSVLFGAVAVTAHELVHAACGVDEFLLAGEEGV